MAVRRSALPSSLYDVGVRRLDGSEESLARYRGEVLLVVNTASKCGFTPQYAGLQTLHRDFASRGFAVLGFPCNQFGRQEPGDAVAIGGFCQLNYGVSFPMFEKVQVNGPSAHPLFRFLEAERPGLLGSKRIKWNFAKFLVDRAGGVVARFGPMRTPASLVADVERVI